MVPLKDNEMVNDVKGQRNEIKQTSRKYKYKLEDIFIK